MDCKGFIWPLIGPDISKQYGGMLSPPEVSGRSSKNLSLKFCSKIHIRFSNRGNFQVFIPPKNLASDASVLSSLSSFLLTFTLPHCADLHLEV